MEVCNDPRPDPYIIADAGCVAGDVDCGLCDWLVGRINKKEEVMKLTDEMIDAMIQAVCETSNECANCTECPVLLRKDFIPWLLAELEERAGKEAEQLDTKSSALMELWKACNVPAPRADIGA